MCSTRTDGEIGFLFPNRIPMFLSSDVCILAFHFFETFLSRALDSYCWVQFSLRFFGVMISLFSLLLSGTKYYRYSSSTEFVQIQLFQVQIFLHLCSRILTSAFAGTIARRFWFINHLVRCSPFFAFPTYEVSSNVITNFKSPISNFVVIICWWVVITRSNFCQFSENVFLFHLVLVEFSQG